MAPTLRSKKRANDSPQKPKTRRGPPATSVTATASPKIAAKARLLSLLKSSDSSIVQACLVEALSKATQRDVSALERLLESLATEAETTSHCVRCHEDYLPNENGPTACQIAHVEPGDYERVLIGYDNLMAVLDCCDKAVYPEGHPHDRHIPYSNWDDKPCILARHTIEVPTMLRLHRRNGNVEEASRDCGCFDWKVEVEKVRLTLPAHQRRY